jgi:ADP-ribose pyrophosphatase
VDGVVGATTESAHFYLARNLSETEMRHDAEEAIVTRWLPFNRVLQMVLNGEITESITVSAIQRVALLGIVTE